jgi:hypothetical protein
MPQLRNERPGLDRSPLLSGQLVFPAKQQAAILVHFRMFLVGYGPVNDNRIPHAEGLAVHGRRGVMYLFTTIVVHLLRHYNFLKTNAYIFFGKSKWISSQSYSGCVFSFL